MVSKIFINLPVKDLQKSIDFFTKLGFTFNPQFTDDSATCMILAENIFTMLMVEERFQTFTKKPVSDAKKATEVLLAIDAESREKVDEIVEKAIAAGGNQYNETQDQGWMYYRSFEDLDGHQWEVGYFDLSQFPSE